MIVSRTNKFLLAGVEAAASVVRPILNRVVMRQASDILLERQRRALASTVDFVQQHMRHVEPVGSKFELLNRALQLADTSRNRLICEFGVFTGTTISYIAKRTSKTIFGFDSFEGLPEKWSNRGIKKGHFAVRDLPVVPDNVVLIKGWFQETLPSFLAQNSGIVGFLHVDCDLYSSTKTVLDFLEPRLAPGTVIVFDEFFNFPEWEEGEHKAFFEYLLRSGWSCEFIGYHGKGEQVAVVLKQKTQNPPSDFGHVTQEVPLVSTDRYD